MLLQITLQYLLYFPLLSYLLGVDGGKLDPLGLLYRIANKKGGFVLAGPALKLPVFLILGLLLLANIAVLLLYVIIGLGAQDLAPEPQLLDPVLLDVLHLGLDLQILLLPEPIPLLLE